MQTKFLNNQRVVFLTNEFRYLDEKYGYPFRKVCTDKNPGLIVTFPNLEDLDEMRDDKSFRQESTGTFMALLQLIKLSLFPDVCTHYHSHVLWADIVGCDPKALVEWLSNLPTEHGMPFKSFVRKNLAKDMNIVMTPPWKISTVQREPDTTLQNYVTNIQPILSNHIHLNDTIFKYITQTHHLVLQEILETMVDMVDQTIQGHINESLCKKMAMSALGNWASTIKDLKTNKQKYQSVQQTSTPRTLWPWLTALILVVVNQYRLKTGKKPLQIESDYVVEVNSFDGDIEAIYETRGPGRMFAAGLMPKYGGGPKR
jgi:hypothetical protein